MAKKSVNCVTANCKIQTEIFLDDFLIIPFDNGTDELKKLFSYFLYNAPNIESKHSPKISREFHDIILQTMLENRHFKYENFCNFNAKIDSELKKGHLEGSEICLKCKRFVCKRKKPSNSKHLESDLECLLRHIRNAIAHGKVYCLHGGNKIHIVFEDENTTKKVSARIVCIKADLEHWKRILTDLRYY